MQVKTDEKNTGEFTFWHKYEESASTHEDRTDRAVLKPYGSTSVILEIENSSQKFLKQGSKHTRVERFSIENSKLIAYIKKYGNKIS